LILKGYEAGVENIMTDLVVDWWRWREFDYQISKKYTPSIFPTPTII